MSELKYTTIEINTIEELKNYLFFDAEYKEDKGRYRDVFVYRGLPNPDYELKTSLQRICKDQKEKLESTILKNFSKYAQLESPSIKDSDWKQMIIGQHHGLPTRLLDWSASSLTALHFATTEGNLDDLDQHDCVVWRIDVIKFNESLPEDYKELLGNQSVFTIDMLEKVSVKKYDEDMGDHNMIILEPPTIDMRIANQYSFFSVVPSKVEKVEDIFERCSDSVVKFVISRNLRWQIRDMLDQVNISERTVYPGLDGIASWLSRHYYVRKVTRLEIIIDNIAKANVDVIVNPANRYLSNRGGVGKAIFYGAGKRLDEEIHHIMKNHQSYDEGTIEETEGYNLSCKKIYHAVTPVWGEDIDKTETLTKLYNDLLNRIVDSDFHSVAIPLLCSGGHGCDKDIAWQIALTCCQKFLEEKGNKYPLTIKFYVLHEKDRIEGEQILNRILGKPATSYALDYEGNRSSRIKR